MKILVFTEGTSTMHSSATGKSRKERVKQSNSKESAVLNYHTYIPNGNAVEKLRKWKNQGAEIFYLTSRTTPEEIDDTKYVLDRFNFPDKKNLLFRQKSEEYKDVAEKLMPDIYIEDDCESIGGAVEMTSTHFGPEVKQKIKTIVIKEFQGIDHLPDSLEQLRKY